MPENKDIGLLWHSFMYEVDRATASLFYLLQGMESVRATELQPYNKLPATQKTRPFRFLWRKHGDCMEICVFGENRLWA